LACPAEIDTNGQSCGTGAFCSTAGTCNAGVCSGTPRDCSDTNACTTDACDEANDICTHANNTLPCDDGLFCTAVDACKDGVCAGTARNCSDTSPCTDDSCNETTDACVHANNTTPCDDAAFCNGADTCSGGTCSIHAGNPCPGPDGDSNCGESCNEALGNCSAADPNSSACDDGDACTESDVCTSGACAGTAIPSCGVTTTTLPDEILCGDAN